MFKDLFNYAYNALVFSTAINEAQNGKKKDVIDSKPPTKILDYSRTRFKSNHCQTGENNHL